MTLKATGKAHDNGISIDRWAESLDFIVYDLMMRKVERVMCQTGHMGLA